MTRNRLPRLAVGAMLCILLACGGLLLEAQIGALFHETRLALETAVEMSGGNSAQSRLTVSRILDGSAITQRLEALLWINRVLCMTLIMMIVVLVLWGELHPWPRRIVCALFE